MLFCSFYIFFIRNVALKLQIFESFEIYQFTKQLIFSKIKNYIVLTLLDLIMLFQKLLSINKKHTSSILYIYIESETF